MHAMAKELMQGGTRTLIALRKSKSLNGDLSDCLVQGTPSLEQVTGKARMRSIFAFDITTHIDEPLLGSAPIQDQLLACNRRECERNIDRKTCITKDIRPVVLADAVSLALFHMKLEEARVSTTQKGGARHGIEAVLIACHENLRDRLTDEGLDGDSQQTGSRVSVPRSHEVTQGECVDRGHCGDAIT
jgi:hypothetical protein